MVIEEVNVEEVPIEIMVYQIRAEEILQNQVKVKVMVIRKRVLFAIALIKKSIKVIEDCVVMIQRRDCRKIS